MDSAHMHLLLNHIPILGLLFALCLGIFGLIRKNLSLEKASLTTIFIVALFTIPAFLSGEGAEEAVEHLSGVSESTIEHHEELAETAFWLMMATGAAALLTLVMWAKKGDRNSKLSALTIVLAIGTFIVMVMVGNDGGKIRHSEIRGESNSGQNIEMEHNDHDDD